MMTVMLKTSHAKCSPKGWGYLSRLPSMEQKLVTSGLNKGKAMDKLVLQQQLNSTLFVGS